MRPISGLELITDALVEIAAYGAGEDVSAEDAALGLSKANRLFDAWNAKGLDVFNVAFLQFVIKPNVQPLSIGEAAQITQASLTGNVATYIADNNFIEGDEADISGCVTPALNVAGALIASSNGKQFTVAIANADIPPENEVNALAVFSGAPAPNYPTSSTRPAKIVDANLILNNVNPPVKQPLTIRDDDWWANNRIPTTPTSTPTDLYYSPQFPNGQIYLWPLPTVTYGLELEIWNNLSELSDLTSKFYLPQGYRDAITYSLAESLCPAFEKPISQDLAKLAANARMKIQGLNQPAPRIGTRDAGMPRSGRHRAGFNWLTGRTSG